MKIQLSFQDINHNSYIKANPFESLDKICEDAECNELLCDDVIDYIPMKEVNRFLHHWIRKIRLGGKFIITGLDLFEVMRHIQNRAIDLSQANITLYGEQKYDWQIRMSCLSSKNVSDVLQEIGFKIIKNSIENFKYTIVAERIK